MNNTGNPSVPRPEDRRHAPATLRNREAILAVLARALPAEGRILEVGSGTGEHAVFITYKIIIS